MQRFLVLGLAVTSLCSMSAQAPLAGKPLDWDKLQVEILERYRALVMLDTTSGHETLAVDYLKKVLEAEGIPTKTFAMNPNRANLVARLKGNGSKRPLLILAHTDVVGVQREKWPVDPFGAVIKDGYVWGRGCRSPKTLSAVYGRDNRVQSSEAPVAYSRTAECEVSSPECSIDWRKGAACAMRAHAAPMSTTGAAAVLSG